MTSTTRLLSLVTFFLLALPSSLFADLENSEYEQSKQTVRIEADDSLLDIVLKLTQGDQNAMKVVNEFMKAAPEIDPDLTPIKGLISFYSFDILGPKLWMLYKDVCKEKIVCVHAVLTSMQMGLVSRTKIEHAIENKGAGLDITKLLLSVHTMLPNLGKAAKKEFDLAKKKGKRNQSENPVELGPQPRVTFISLRTYIMLVVTAPVLAAIIHHRMNT